MDLLISIYYLAAGWLTAFTVYVAIRILRSRYVRFSYPSNCETFFDWLYCASEFTHVPGFPQCTRRVYTRILGCEFYRDYQKATTW